MPVSKSFTRRDVSFTSGDDYCSAWLYLPDDVESPPVVILGHGLGGTREMGLAAYAERFAAAGIAAFAFTYRHFGDSGGQPRQLLSIKRQLRDWDAAIGHIKARPDVDGTKLAIWGSSFGGGHAITVASRHPELLAAVAQCPFTDGLASARALGPVDSAKLLALAGKDVLAAIRRKEPVRIGLVGKPGSMAAMTAADALPGYLALIPDDVEFVNEIAARFVPTATVYRPGRSARKVAMPILFCICDQDTVAPPAETLAYARTAPKGEIKTYDVGHFDIYRGAPFDAVVADQVDFLTRHLEF
ncbi:MAG TPA: alpha/beta hydrolase [Aeromicrobium sp.]|nr:alpha/beta hydrolase [Aeromicrobium sp.]